MRTFFIYILSSRSRVLYTGVTHDLQRRVREHRHPQRDCFTGRYRVNRLVYFESVENSLSAVAREKQIKGMSRKRKIELIEQENAAWADLSEQWESGGSAPR